MKILICDIDSSMDLSSNKELIDAINNFTSKKNLFIIATDRPIGDMAETFSFVNIDISFYICNDGAVIFDQYFNVIYRKDIEQQIVRHIFHYLDDDPNILETFIDTSHGFVQKLDVCANGIIARPYDIVKANITLDNVVKKYPSVQGYVNDEFLKIIDSDVNKAVAIHYLEDTYRLKKEDIYVLGKNIDDVEMVQTYNGYVLSDSCDDLKKYAKDEVENVVSLVNILLELE